MTNRSASGTDLNIGKLVRSQVVTEFAKVQAAISALRCDLRVAIIGKQGSVGIIDIWTDSTAVSTAFKRFLISTGINACVGVTVHYNAGFRGVDPIGALDVKDWEAVLCEDLLSAVFMLHRTILTNSIDYTYDPNDYSYERNEYA